MKVLGHRGYSGEYPENTMLAFQKAFETGCDGVELDVQLSKDGIPVIMHDEAVDRTSDGKGLIKDYTYRELCRFNCSYPDKFKDAFDFQKIPSLEEYLAWMKQVSHTFVTNIELKNSIYYYGGLEKKVIDMVRSFGLEDRIILSSFNNASIVNCKLMAPEIQTGFLIETCIGNPGVYVREQMVDFYHPNLKYLTQEHVTSCMENGIGVNVWTVNEEEDLRKVEAWGVQAAITNFPDRGVKAAKG
ncbi:MAG TPA: glycerophosphodiester phosphodiesterase [Candidatus Hungatella pullicola]|nr:glycerophosphodiester phosphodiesterase [Candidatus Hungatella pullicola]